MKRFLLTIIFAAVCVLDLRAQTQNVAILTETVWSERMIWNTSTYKWDFSSNEDLHKDPFLWRFELDAASNSGNVSAAPVNRDQLFRFRIKDIRFDQNESIVTMILDGIELNSGNPIVIMVSRSADESQQGRSVSVFDEKERKVLFFTTAE